MTTFDQCWAAMEAAEGSAVTEQLLQKTICSKANPVVMLHCGQNKGPLMVDTWRKLQMAIKVARGQNTAFGSPSTLFLAYKESSRVALKT